MTTDTTPLIFLMGTTGQTGRLILEDFDRNPAGVRIRIGVRKQKDLERLRAEGRDQEPRPIPLISVLGPPRRSGMNRMMMAPLAAAMLSLAACGGDGDDALANQAEQEAEKQADALDAAAGNASGAQREALEQQAEATRDAGEARAEAIDDSDVDADELSQAQKDAMVKGQ